MRRVEGGEEGGGARRRENRRGRGRNEGARKVFASLLDLFSILLFASDGACSVVSSPNQLKPQLA